MARTSISTAGFSVDTSGLKTLAKDLRKASLDARRALRLGLKAAGDVVAADAKERASFSSRIPGSIRTRTSGVSVRVVAGGDKAPDAAPLENKGRNGTFRHPVFGDRTVWVAQKAHPFLAPALSAHEDEVVDLISKAVGAALDAVNLHSETS